MADLDQKTILLEQAYEELKSICSKFQYESEAKDMEVKTLQRELTRVRGKDFDVDDGKDIDGGFKFFLLYGASSFLTIWYENSWLATAALCLNFVAFVILISALWPRVSFKDLGYGLTAIFVVFVCVNA